MSTIPITIAAAFLQNLRSAMQRQLMARLREPLSAEGASYARFLYAVPFVVVYFSIIAGTSTEPLPGPHAVFLAYAGVGGLMQILATVCLIRSFAHGSFAVGTAYSKTETLQAVVFGFLMLGESITVLAGIGILISLAGVLFLSLGGRGRDEPRPQSGGPRTRHSRGDRRRFNGRSLAISGGDPRLRHTTGRRLEVHHGTGWRMAKRI